MPVSRWVPIAGLFVGFVAACSDVIGPSETSALAPSVTGGKTGAPDEKPLALSESCSAFTAPTEGDNCSGALAAATSDWDRTCEYGHDVLKACNDVFVCSSEVWSRRATSCRGRCPSSFDAISPGAECERKSVSGSSVGCSYFEGTCGCVAEVDGGTEQGTGLGRWRCAPPPSGGCPAQRPPLGARCVRAMTCDYGSCLLEKDLTFSCVEGAWVQSDTDRSCR